MKVETSTQALDLLAEKKNIALSTLRLVWKTPMQTGYAYHFLELDGNLRRTLWVVGPRGAVERRVSFSHEQWRALR